MDRCFTVKLHFAYRNLNIHRGKPLWDLNLSINCPVRRKSGKQFPLPAGLDRVKEERDAQIRDVLTGKDSRFLVIIGPCSADNEHAVLDYVTRLAAVQEKVKERLILIPRVYTNKPRTTGEGLQGPAAPAGSGEKAQHVRGSDRHPQHAHARGAGDRHDHCRRDAVSGKPAVSGRSDVLHCRRRPVGGKPAAPPGGQRLRRSRGYEKSHQR